MVKSFRSNIFSSILSQPLEFFNKTENSTGNLTAVLAQEVKSINGTAIDLYFLILQGIAGVIVGLMLSLIYNWYLGLVSVTFLPLIIICIYFQNKERRKSIAKNSGFSDSSRAIISDSILNHTTISSLANEDILIENYFINYNNICKAF